MQPELNVFGLTLQTFGLMLGIAFIVCGALTARYLKEIGKPVDWAYEFIFAAIIGGIVGSRLWWIGENWDTAKDDLLGSLFSGSGLVFYGGAIGGALCVLRLGAAPRLARPAARSTWARRRWRRATRSGGSAASSPATATTACPGTARGRWPTRTAPCRPTSPVHPTPDLRDTRHGRRSRCCCGAGGTACGPGTLFALYRSCSRALERFLVEFLRRNDGRRRSGSPSRS